MARGIQFNQEVFYTMSKKADAKDKKINIYQKVLDYTLAFINKKKLIDEYRKYLKDEAGITFEPPKNKNG